MHCVLHDSVQTSPCEESQNVGVFYNCVHQAMREWEKENMWSRFFTVSQAIQKWQTLAQEALVAPSSLSFIKELTDLWFMWSVLIF